MALTTAVTDLIMVFLEECWKALELLTTLVIELYKQS